jgi:hypothetical protein
MRLAINRRHRLLDYELVMGGTEFRDVDRLLAKL